MLLRFHGTGVEQFHIVLPLKNVQGNGGKDPVLFQPVHQGLGETVVIIHQFNELCVGNFLHAADPLADDGFQDRMVCHRGQFKELHGGQFMTRQLVFDPSHIVRQ